MISTRRRWFGLDGIELGILVAFVLVSCAPLGLLAWHALANGRIWLAIDGGALVADELQYVGWIREASEHVLISNHFQAEPAEQSYLHPGALLSAGLVRLGLSPAVAYLLWKPVAVLALFASVRAYVTRLLPTAPTRWSALVLALFFFPPIALITGEGSAGPGDSIPLAVVSAELWPSGWLWGYYFSALAIAGLVAGLLLYERDRRSGRPSAWPALIGLLTGWFQPWAGALLIGVILGGEALLAVSRRRSGAADLGRRQLLGVLVPVLAATAAPLVYYAVLGRVDSSWAGDPSAHDFLNPPWWAIALMTAPLAIPALLAYRRPPATFQDAAVRIWPPLSLGLLVVLVVAFPGTYAPHALRGLSIPLAILAVTGLATIRWRYPRRATLVAVACGIGLLTVPAAIDALSDARQRINNNTGPYYLARGERDALDYLARDGRPGAVYATVSMGGLIPAETGRRTPIGHPFWTPDYWRRRTYTNIMFGAAANPAATRALAQYSGSRFLFSGCDDGSVDLAPVLRPILASTRRFDCATVYEVKDSARRGQERQ